MDFEFENRMLDRFRTKHRELAARGASVRLYALVDSAAMTRHETNYLYKDLDNVQRTSLYAGSGLATLEETGPSLVVMPHLRGDERVTWSTGNGRPAGPINLFLRLIRLARHNAQLVSWIWTPHDLEPCIDHLQTLLHARLGPDDTDAWFFFYQPPSLRALHRGLPDPTRRQVFGPCYAWWTLDKHAELVELPGEGLPVPPAWDAFPVPADVVDALHREVMPLQVLAWLRKTKPELFTDSATNAQLCEIAPFVERAMNYGLSGKTDMAVFVAWGLRYKTNYEMHPVVQQVLATARSVPLIDAYMALDSEVWQEIAATAHQRAEDERIRQLHEAFREQGFVSMKARFVNASGMNLWNIQITSPRGTRDDRQRIGYIDGEMYREFTLDVKTVDVPLPGERMVLEWIEPHHLYKTSEVVVRGELPRDAKAGMLVVTFSEFGRSAVMHAEEPSVREQRA